MGNARSRSMGEMKIIDFDGRKNKLHSKKNQSEGCSPVLKGKHPKSRPRMSIASHMDKSSSLKQPSKSDPRATSTNCLRVPSPSMNSAISQHSDIRFDAPRMKNGATTPAVTNALSASHRSVSMCATSDEEQLRRTSDEVDNTASGQRTKGSIGGRRATLLLMPFQRDDDVFTDEKRAMIQESWRAIVASVRADLAMIGSSIFALVFAQCAELRPVFSVPSHVPIGQLQAYEPFTRFARVFTTILDMCARQCRSTTFEADMGAMLRMYGRRHQGKPGFRLEYMRVIVACVEQYITAQVTSLDTITCPVMECINGWRLLLAYICMKMTEGYHDQVLDERRSTKTKLFAKRHSSATVLASKWF